MPDEKTIWGIHMERYHELKAVEQKFVAIGWPAVGDLSKISPNRDAFKKSISVAYPATKAGAIPVLAGTLFRFSNEMKKGDLIIYPSKPNRMANLGTIESDYLFDAKVDPSYPNRRKVKWLRAIPRAEFSQSALNEIGSAVTLFQVKNNAEEFMLAFEGKLAPIAEVDEEATSVAADRTEDNTKDFAIKVLKSKLDPYQFEHFVGHLLEKLGYYARVTQKSGDAGVDIIAHKDVLGFHPHIVMGPLGVELLGRN